VGYSEVTLGGGGRGGKGRDRGKGEERGEAKGGERGRILGRGRTGEAMEVGKVG